MPVILHKWYPNIREQESGLCDETVIPRMAGWNVDGLIKRVLDCRASPEDLQQSYSSLLGARPPSSRNADYNLLLTRELMLLVPRFQDLYGPVSCNALGFAGTLLVRSVAELDFVVEQGPMKILTAVTFPWDLAN